MHGTLPLSEASARTRRRELGVAACAGVLFGLLAYVSIELTRGSGRIAVVWLPNAFAVAWLLRRRPGGETPLLVGLFAGNLAANLLHADPAGTAMALASANTVEIALATMLVRRACGERPDMTDLKDLARFVGLAGLCAPLASGMLAAGALASAGKPFFETFAYWFISDGLALVIISPCLMIFADALAARRRPSRRQLRDWLVLTTIGTTATAFVFAQTQFPLLFLAPLVVVSHAFWLGSLGTAFSTIKIAVIATIFTELGYGPINLLDYPARTELLVLLTFLASCFLVGMPVAAALNGRDRMVVELDAKRRELSLLADNITDAVLQYDLHGICTYASPSVREVLGRPPEDFIGTTASEKLHADAEEAVIAVERKLVSGEAEKERFTYRRYLDDDEGREVWIEADCATVRNRETGAREGIIVSARDVSRRILLERQLVRARRHAEQAARAKSQFLANMSHEIRTPMNGVLGFADLLRSSDLPPEAASHAQMIARSGRSMMAILNDILDLSKIEAGQMQLERQAVDVVQEIEDSIALQQADAQAKGIALVFECDPAMPPAVICDPLRLRQMLLNLIGNAVKFTEEGSVTVRLDARGDSFEITVEDTGIGIEPDRAEAIFNPFVQAEEATTRRFGGTGLGLAITRNLAEMFDGSLSLSSVPGYGTRFCLSLPLEAANRRAEDRGDRDGDIAPTFSERARVLLVEDHDVNRMLVCAMLERCGLAADTAHGGEDGIAKVLGALDAGRPYELVLMDVQMPDCDGYEATRAIRLAGLSAEQLPIVALTANAFPEDIAEALRAGMQAHLAKPLVFEKLVSALNRWLPHRIVDRTAQDACDLPQAAGVEDRWRQRRQEALQVVRDAVEEGALGTSAAEDLARTMHKLAGTAGMFGEALLGERAGALERAIRAGLPADEVLGLARALLREAVPELEKETAAPRQGDRRS